MCYTYIWHMIIEQYYFIWWNVSLLFNFSIQFSKHFKYIKLHRWIDTQDSIESGTSFDIGSVLKQDMGTYVNLLRQLWIHNRVRCSLLHAMTFIVGWDGNNISNAHSSYKETCIINLLVVLILRIFCTVCLARCVTSVILDNGSCEIECKCHTSIE